MSLGSAHRQATDASTNAGFSFSGLWCLKSPSLFLSCPLATAFSLLDSHFSNNGGCMSDGVTFLLHPTHAKLLDQGGCLFLSHQPHTAKLTCCQFVPLLGILVNDILTRSYGLGTCSPAIRDTHLTAQAEDSGAAHGGGRTRMKRRPRCAPLRTAATRNTLVLYFLSLSPKHWKLASSLVISTWKLAGFLKG